MSQKFLGLAFINMKLLCFEESILKIWQEKLWCTYKCKNAFLFTTISSNYSHPKMENSHIKCKVVIKWNQNRNPPDVNWRIENDDDHGLLSKFGEKTFRSHHFMIIFPSCALITIFYYLYTMAMARMWLYFIPSFWTMHYSNQDR
jgi:hypothetical protein